MNKKSLVRNIAFFTALFLTGCAQEIIKSTPQRPSPVWFDVSERYAFPDFEGEVVPHHFFDPKPEVNKQENELYFVITTPKDSQYGYQMDLVSGQIYRRYRYCREVDIWDKTNSTPSSSVLSVGVVPRVIDSSGKPQQIVVAGEPEYFQEFHPKKLKAQKVRVVGGVVQQYCKRYPCQVKNRWLSRLLLVAVNPNDPNFADVQDLNDLKQKLSWEDVEVFLQNGFGRNVALASPAPAYRLTGEVGPKRALKEVEERGLVFDQEQQLSLQTSCHALSNYLWFASQRVRKNIRDETQIPIDKLSLYEGDEWERKRIQSFMKDTKASLTKQAHYNFAAFLNHFVKDYGKSYRTCAGYVRSSNINIDPARHWFLAQLESYFHMMDLGQVYLCSREAWIPNPLNSKGEHVYDPESQLENCSHSQLDEAFRAAITSLSALRSARREHYRYIQYDSIDKGSHQKIYSWVHDNGKRTSCDKDDAQIDQLPIFPEDIKWKPFTPKRVRDFFQVIR